MRRDDSFSSLGRCGITKMRLATFRDVTANMSNKSVNDDLLSAFSHALCTFKWLTLGIFHGCVIVPSKL